MSTEHNNSLVSNNRYAINHNEFKNLSDKVDSIQRALANLTDLISKSLEEKRYAATRERERRW